MKRLSFFLTLFIFLILTMIGPIWAAQYYVDSDNGNDSWDGLYPDHSQGANHGPWMSKEFIVTWAPGDIVSYKRGTTNLYNLGYRIMMGVPGTSNNWITLNAYGTGSKPVICPGVIVSSWTSIGDGKYTATVADDTGGFFEDRLNIHKAADANCADAGIVGGQWFVTGTTLTYKPGSLTPASYELVYSTGQETVTPNFYYSGQYVKVQDLVFLGCYAGLQNSGNDVHDILIKNCQFIGVGFNAINIINGSPTVDMFNVIIDGVTFSYCANNIYFVDVNGTNAHFNNCAVRNCIMQYTNMYSNGGWQWAAGDVDGISVQDVSNTIFENNEIYGGYILAGGIDIWFSAVYQSTGNVIRNNYIHDIPLASGIIYGGAAGANNVTVDMYNNIVTRCGVSPPTTINSSWAISSTSGTVTISTNPGATYTGLSSTTSDYIAQVDGNWAPYYPGGADGNANIYADKASAGNWRNGLLKFGGLSNLSGKTVTGATLTIHAQSGAHPETITLKRCLRNWTTGATWNKYDGTNSWTTGGGVSDSNDRLAAASLTLQYSSDGNYSTTIWQNSGNSSSQFVADVQYMIDTNNFGWVMERTDTSNDGQARQLSGENEGIVEGLGLSPILTVNYATTYIYTYDTALTPKPDAVWENSVPLIPVANVGLVESTPGSFSWESATLHVHATDGSNPGTNGRIYKAFNVSAGGPKGGYYLNKSMITSNPAKIYNNIAYENDVNYYLVAQAGYYNLKNNISLNPILYHTLTPVQNNLVFDYNDYYPDGPFFYYNNGAVAFSTWKDASHINGDSHSITTDPIFLNAGGSFALATDFKIPKTSPAYHAGTEVGLSTDYAGIPWGSPNPSMGAYEVQSAVGGGLSPNMGLGLGNQPPPGWLGQ